MPIEQRNPSNLGTDHTRCLTEGGQDVMPITGFPDGKAQIPVHPMGAVAIHIGARLPIGAGR
jgi:hypothetical protein